MSRASDLLRITAFARAGALGEAWRRFREAGMESARDDPAVFTLKGRLLKDQSKGLAGEERTRALRDAADAYGAAAAITGAAYPLINAATLAFLGGEVDLASRRAAEVLDRLRREEAPPDTPYYSAATRAEALLLLGRLEEAKTALSEAIALQPRAWEDHASTLRQFAAILDVQGADTGWLDALRPPTALHFAGHMAVGPDDLDLSAQVRALLVDEKVGFAFGALAGGADIVVAETVLNLGGQLHVVLPAAPDVFKAASVSPAGDAWAERFDRVLEEAESVRFIGHPGDPQTGAAISLASDLAMGLAVMQAEVLATRALQLLVLNGAAGEATGRMGARWREAGLPLRALRASRMTEVFIPEPGSQARCLAVMALEVAGSEDLTGAAALMEKTAMAGEILAHLGASEVGRQGGRLEAAFETPAAAARAMMELSAGLGDGACRGALSFGLVSAGPGLAGPARRLAQEMLASAATGAVIADETFAAALTLQPGSAPARLEFIGELEISTLVEPIRLFALAF